MTSATLDHILFWPLQLKGDLFEMPLSREWTTWFELESGGIWSEVSLGDRGLTGFGAKEQMAEFLYFHPFVRDILFRQREDQPLRLLRRNDITSVSIQLKPGKLPFLMDVRRLHLYLFETKIAVLVTELTAREHIDLRDVEELLDSLRRRYPPYYDDEDHGGHCPEKVSWRDAQDNEVSVSNYHDLQHATAVTEKCEASVSEHWGYLVKPLRRWPTDDSAPSWRQLADERIAGMTFLAHAAPESVTEEEFVRLTLLDAGPPDTLPYGTRFLQNFQERYCYDRYWDYKRQGHDGMTTRYTCCGYHFLVLAKDDSSSGSHFVMNERNGLLFHFRHHY